MPSAKPKYDATEGWKIRSYSQASWDALSQKVQDLLRPYHPAQQTRGNQSADKWARDLLRAAYDELVTTQWQHRRRTKAELRAEHADILKTLKRSAGCLSSVSHDLRIMLDPDLDILGCRDRIETIIESFENAGEKIVKLKRAMKPSDIEHLAATRIAHRTLEIMREYGGSSAVTADMGTGYVSDAINVMKIIGSALGLNLVETTWRGIAAKAKKSLL